MFLRIWCNNSRSVENKTISLCNYVRSNDFDVVAVTETRLGNTTDKTRNSELVPSGYVMKHIPRMDRKGGGVALEYGDAVSLGLISSSRDGDFTHFEHRLWYRGRWISCTYGCGLASANIDGEWRPGTQMTYIRQSISDVSSNVNREHQDLL